MTMLFDNESDRYLISLEQRRWNLGLDNISLLMDSIGKPHENLKCVHVAGTNGKGTTCVLLEAMLRNTGLRTGLFTSPHLRAVEERIRINGECIARQELRSQLAALRPYIDTYRCTYFEALTAIAFNYFAEEQVDVVVLETGLGGRLDATNIVNPVLSIITEIDLEHQQYLGDTIESIAREKAGIIKPNAPCIAASRHSGVVAVLRDRCSKLNAPFLDLDEVCSIEGIGFSKQRTRFSLKTLSYDLPGLSCNLAGSALLRNATLAVTAYCWYRENQGLPVSVSDITAALSDVTWPGRMQVISSDPPVVLDVAHNPASVRSFLHDMPTLFRYNRLIIVIGLLADKNYKEIAKLVAKAADKVYVTELKSDRALPGQRLYDCFKSLSIDVERIENHQDFLRQLMLMKEKGHAIGILGSHYLAGDVLTMREKERSKKT